ncbi:MAG: hypothetical protein ABIZ70_07685 [Gemmatimonadales bacterium]
MPLHDLVSPWAAAAEADDAPQARALFRARHAALLERLRRQRAPHDAELALERDPVVLRRLAHRAADPEWQQRLRDTMARAASLGADVAATVTLLSGDGTGDAAEPIPARSPIAALFVERGDDATLTVALIRSLAAITRWCAPDSRSPVRAVVTDDWDRWECARRVPLAEWAYLEGVGLHLAAELFPEFEPTQLLGISRGALHRLRERERLLRTLFLADLEQPSLGAVLRWLAPGAPPSARTVGNVVIPPGAGRYLAWRMSAERVARVGTREAIRMSASS